MKARVFQTWCLIVLAQVSLFAQRDFGTLTGTVTDTSGAVVAGAKILITEQATGVKDAVEADTAFIFRWATATGRGMLWNVCWSASHKAPSHGVLYGSCDEHFAAISIYELYAGSAGSSEDSGQTGCAIRPRSRSYSETR
jgi:hypothetical protein